MKSSNQGCAVARFRVFIAAWILYAGYYACRKDLGRSPGTQSPISHLALALVWFGISYAIGQVAGGTLADRYGARRTAVAGAAISIISTLLLGYSRQPGLVVLFELLNGFGQGFGWPALLKLMGSWFRSGERRRVLGWWSTSYILGGLVATSLTMWLGERPGSYLHSARATRGFALLQSPYIVSSLLLLCATVFFYRRTAGLTETPASVVQHPNVGDAGTGWRSVLRSRDIQIISAMYFFLKMTRYTLLFWLPLYLASSLGYSSFGAEHTASYFELFGFLGPLAVGYAPARWFVRRSIPLGASMLFALAFICLLHPMLAGSGRLGMVISISLMGLLIHGADLLMSGMAVLDAVPAIVHGRATGLVNAVGSIGQALSPLLITLFVSRQGWAELFDLFVFLALVSGSICLIGAHLIGGDEPQANRSVLGSIEVPL